MGDQRAKLGHDRRTGMTLSTHDSCKRAHLTKGVMAGAKCRTAVPVLRTTAPSRATWYFPSMAEPQNFFLNPMRSPEPAAVKSREELIAEIAYFRAKERGFAPGHELDDWLAAEAEVQRMKEWQKP
jgi:hypothetical protein